MQTTSSSGGNRTMPMNLAAWCRASALVGCSIALVGGAIPAVAKATVTVRVTTTSMPNMGAHRTAVYVTPSCGSDRLVGGGSYLRNASSESTVPNNGLVLFGLMPTNSSGVPVGDGSTNPAYWTTLGGFSGQSESGDQASAFAMCSSATSNTVVETATTTGANATQESSAPTITTATCESGRLVGGGAIEDTPGQVNDGSTTGNNGTLKPLAS